MIGRYALLILIAGLYLAPVAFMLAGSLKPDERVFAEAGTLAAFWPAEISLQNYHDVFARVDFGRYMFNSLFITTAITLGGLAVNAPAGYALARLRWPGRRTCFALILALLIIPFEAIAVPLFYVVSLLSWRDTLSVQIIPFIANAFSIYLFYSFFLSLPRELEEAARLDGAGYVRTFLFVVLPNAKPVCATASVLTFLMQWGSFLWPLMVTTSESVRPLPVAIATFHTLPPIAWGDILAFAVMMVAPVLLLFVLFQGWFVRGVIASGIKG